MRSRYSFTRPGQFVVIRPVSVRYQLWQSPAQTLSPRVRQTVTAHKLRSHDDAVDLVRQIERGDLAGQSAQ